MVTRGPILGLVLIKMPLPLMGYQDATGLAPVTRIPEPRVTMRILGPTNWGLTMVCDFDLATSEGIFSRGGLIFLGTSSPAMRCAFTDAGRRTFARPRSLLGILRLLFEVDLLHFEALRFFSVSSVFGDRLVLRRRIDVLDGFLADTSGFDRPEYSRFLVVRSVFTGGVGAAG